jgi:4-hydroxybenzoate polyprenyltransferase
MEKTSGLSFSAAIGGVKRGLTRIRTAFSSARQRLYTSPRYRFLEDRLTQYTYLCRLNKPIGIYLLLWPTLWALFIAGNGRPHPLILFVFIIGTVLMRSAGCAINDFADRDIDPHVSRTRQRPVATGKVSPREAVGVFMVLALSAFGLVWLMNRLTVYLSAVGVVLAALYPFAKRYTYMPQVVLGAAFGWAVPMAFAAQTGELPLVAWLLFVATVLWTTAYDTMYAMVDREDDLKIGVKSTAILFGEADVLIVMFLQALVLISLMFTGQRLQLGPWYFGGLAVAGLFVVYQYLLIRHRDPARCFQAFLSNHYFGMAVFMGLLLHYITRFLN